MTKVKICGLYRLEDIHLMNRCLPDYVGFILYFPKSHRNITLAQLQEWVEILDPSIQKVGVFVNQPLERIVDCGNYLDVIQLHGEESQELVAQIRKLCPGKEIWKAFTVKIAEEVAEAMAFSADKVLLDYGKGEGKVFDWTLLQQVQGEYILAGGITPQNAREAIDSWKAPILDVSSGVEVEKRKDPEKVEALMEAVRGRGNLPS